MQPTQTHRVQVITGTDPPIYWVLNRRGRKLGKVIFKWAFPFNVPFTVKAVKVWKNPA